MNFISELHEIDIYVHPVWPRLEAETMSVHKMQQGGSHDGPVCLPGTHDYTYPVSQGLDMGHATLWTEGNRPNLPHKYY